MDAANAIDVCVAWIAFTAACAVVGAVLGAASRLTRWVRDRRQPAASPPQRDALTELADLEAHFDAYAARIDRLYLREENPQP